MRLILIDMPTIAIRLEKLRLPSLRRRNASTRSSLAPIEPPPYHPPPFIANTAGISMLQQMRAFSKSIFASILMGGLALSFVVWGIADVFRGRSDTDVATVGSSAISYEVFSRDYRNFLRNRGAEEKRDITPEMARKAGLGDVALDQIITRTVLDNLVNKLGLTVSDADVSAEIRAMNVFNGPLGTFDKQTFDRVLSQRGFTEQGFVDGMRGDMARDQLLGPVEDGFQIPPGYAHALFAYSTELRSTEYVMITPQALGTVAAPSDAVLTAYVKANPSRFSTPEYRDVTGRGPGPEDVSASIKITDVQIHRLRRKKVRVRDPRQTRCRTDHIP